jgi:hypothetical protein
MLEGQTLETEKQQVRLQNHLRIPQLSEYLWKTLLRFELAKRGMIGCSGYMGGQDQDLRLIRDNIRCVGLLLNVSYCYVESV